MRYWISGITYTEDEFNEVIETVLNEMADDEFDDYLDEVYGEVEIMNYRFDVSAILKNLDRIAYHEEKSGYVSMRIEDVKYDLERGRAVELGGYKFAIE